MVRLTTVALIERKPDITRSLFTRYWRDVHGVMAVRIPGFESYTQYHVTPLTNVGSLTTEPFEGVAVVTFARSEDRAGLAASDVSQFIRRDEQNVFRRALLYNLEAGATTSVHAAGRADDTADPPWLADFRGDAGERASPVTDGVEVAVNGAPSAVSAFLLVPAGTGILTGAIIAALGTEGLTEMYAHDLASGDPNAWNQTDVSDGCGGRRFSAVLHGRWTDGAAATSAMRRAIAAAHGEVTAYRIDVRYVMVERNRPTAVGLRGWDAVQTILEASAYNQLDAAVTAAIYGIPRAQDSA